MFVYKYCDHKVQMILKMFYCTRNIQPTSTSVHLVGLHTSFSDISLVFIFSNHNIAFN